MITLTDVHKRYWTPHGLSPWILRGISLEFPPDRSVGIIGRNGAGKSTLMRLIAGSDTPDRGKVERRCRASWPLGLTSTMQRDLTGRQNARFTCRIHGFESDIEDRLEFIHKFSELGAAFDEPINTYSSGMRGRLSFSLSFAFDFDVYLIDEGMSAGDYSFTHKATKAFKDRAARSRLIMVSHSESTIRSLCQAVVWVHEGRALWFDSVTEAIKSYRRSFAA
jgi:capsular polysaccharide transport system ATP-binding protein